MLELLRKRRQEQEQVLVEDYEQLTAALADEQAVDPEQTELILAASGRTLEQLESDVETLRRRRRLAAQLDEALEARQRGIEAEQQIAEADTKLQQAKRRHAAKVEPLRLAMAQAQDAAMQEHRARQELLRTAPERLQGKQQELERRSAALGKQIAQARDRGNQLASVLTRLERQLPERERLAKGSSGPNRQAAAEALHKLQTSLSRTREELGETQSRIEQLREQQGNIQQQTDVVLSEMLKP